MINGALMTRYIATLSTCLLMSCGGSSSGDSSESGNVIVSSDRANADMVITGVNTFGFVDFPNGVVSVNPEDDIHDPYTISIDVMNIGTSEGSPSNGVAVLTYSLDPDFMNDVTKEVINFGFSPFRLAPGESGSGAETFDQKWFYPIRPRLAECEDANYSIGDVRPVYAYVELNADYRETRIPIHQTIASLLDSPPFEEANRRNNRSAVFEINVLVNSSAEGGRCTKIDAFEENDSLETAYPMEFGVEYRLTDAGDSFDAMSIELEANTVYVVSVSEPGTAGWIYHIYNESGERIEPFLENNLGSLNATARAIRLTTSGRYTFVFINLDPGFKDTTIVEINHSE